MCEIEAGMTISFSSNLLQKYNNTTNSRVNSSISVNKKTSALDNSPKTDRSSINNNTAMLASSLAGLAVLGTAAAFGYRPYKNMRIESNIKKLINNLYNAYTYTAHRDLSQEIEAQREDWIISTLDIAKLEESFRTKNIPKTLKILEKYLDIQDIFKDFERNKLKKLQSLLKHLEQIFTQDLDNKNIRDVIGNANQNLLLIDGIDVIEQFKYPNTNDENYFDAVYEHVDELTYACAKKIVLELFSDNSRYMTVHKSKGREFDSVLVNLEPFSSRTSSEKDFKPEEIFTSQKAIIENNPTYEEYLRIAYVACSRAINKLYIHLHGDESIALKIKKTLDTYYNVENNICPFYEFVYC